MRRLGDIWHISMGLWFPPEEKPIEGETLDPKIQAAFMRKETTLAELRLWYSSFESMMKAGKIPATVGSLMLRMHFKVAVLTVKTTLHTSYEHLPEMWEIVDLCRKILIGLKSDKTPKFALDVGVVIPLYLVGIKCSVTSVRREAMELLFDYPRREGLWDSCVAGSIINWIMTVEGVYEDRARGAIPAWARINSLDMSVDTTRRQMYLTGLQSVSERDRSNRKLETSIRF